MKSLTNEHFWKCYADLPQDIRRQAREAYDLFTKDPYYPSLHFKRIHSTRPIFSARISMDYRAWVSLTVKRSLGSGSGRTLTMTTY